MRLTYSLYDLKLAVTSTCILLDFLSCLHIRLIHTERIIRMLTEEISWHERSTGRWRHRQLEIVQTVAVASSNQYTQKHMYVLTKPKDARVPIMADHHFLMVNGSLSSTKASELVPCSLLPHWNSMRFFATVSLSD